MIGNFFVGDLSSFENSLKTLGHLLICCALSQYPPPKKASYFDTLITVLNNCINKCDKKNKENHKNLRRILCKIQLMTTELRSEFFLTKKGTTKLNLALFGAKNGKREGPLEEEVDPAFLRDLNGVIR